MGTGALTLYESRVPAAEVDSRYAIGSARGIATLSLKVEGGRSWEGQVVCLWLRVSAQGPSPFCELSYAKPPCFHVQPLLHCSTLPLVSILTSTSMSHST